MIKYKKTTDSAIVEPPLQTTVSYYFKITRGKKKEKLRTKLVFPLSEGNKMANHYINLLWHKFKKKRETEQVSK